MKNYSLGENWFDLYYDKIQQSLGYSRERDAYSRDALTVILSSKQIAEPDVLQDILKDQTVVMLGAGPSLDYDIQGLSSFLEDEKVTIVAADGAADAMYKIGLAPSVIVSDLDSCSPEILCRNSNEGYVFAHAHGDNVELVKKIVPELGLRVFGTTQVSSVNRVVNFGGLTDGDRACYVASSYDPSAIIIAGMDFGIQEGDYSKNRYENKPSSLRQIKLAWGKSSLEYLVQKRRDIEFYNVTRFGQEIAGVKRLSYSEATSIAS